MKTINVSDIVNMEKRQRTNFVNSLTGFKSLNLAGTISSSGITNLAPVSSVIHFGASPALMGMVIRPDSVPRHTLENILETGVWTLNHVRSSFYLKAHQCSARYERGVSEFRETGLTEYYSSRKAPYVKESPIKISLELEERIDIVTNSTHLLIGSIQEVILEEDVVTEDGFVDIEKAGTITVAGLDSYHSTQLLSRLPYATINQGSSLM